MPAVTAASREAGETVRLSAPRCGTAPERVRAAAPAAPAAVPTADPARPVTRPVRRTARRTWRLLAPTQRSRPITRFWRATRAVKVVAMTIPATRAHTGASRLRTVVIMVPPPTEETARRAMTSSASCTMASGWTAWTTRATSSCRALVPVPGRPVTYSLS